MKKSTIKRRWHVVIMSMLILFSMLISTACKVNVAEEPAGTGEMKTIALEDVPYRESFEAFVHQAAWPPSDYYYYHSSETPEDGAIGCIMMRLLQGGAMITPADLYRKGDKYPYDMTYYVEGTENFGDSGDYREYEPDPRGWFPGGEFGSYYTFDQDQFESYLRNIWHFNDEAIEKARERWVDDHVGYVSDGKYYHVTSAGGEIYATEIKEIQTDGVDYLVTYMTGTPSDYSDPVGIDESGLTNKYIQDLRLETIDGKQYWTIYSNVKCVEENVQDTQEVQDERDGLLDFGAFTIVAPGYEYSNSESVEGGEALMYEKGESSLCVKWEDGELSKEDYSNVVNVTVDDAVYSGVNGFEVILPGMSYIFTFNINGKSWQIDCSDEADYYEIVETIKLK